jgi:hypothetical protein
MGKQPLNRVCSTNRGRNSNISNNKMFKYLKLCHASSVFILVLAQMFILIFLACDGWFQGMEGWQCV